jgi:hypothetical protein
VICEKNVKFFGRRGRPFGGKVSGIVGFEAESS